MLCMISVWSQDGNHVSLKISGILKLETYCWNVLLNEQLCTITRIRTNIKFQQAQLKETQWISLYLIRNKCFQDGKGSVEDYLPDVSLNSLTEKNMMAFHNMPYKTEESKLRSRKCTFLYTIRMFACGEKHAQMTSTIVYSSLNSNAKIYFHYCFSVFFRTFTVLDAEFLFCLNLQELYSA